MIALCDDSHYVKISPGGKKKVIVSFSWATLESKCLLKCAFNLCDTNRHLALWKPSLCLPGCAEFSRNSCRVAAVTSPFPSPFLKASLMLMQWDRMELENVHVFTSLGWMVNPIFRFFKSCHYQRGGRSEDADSTCLFHTKSLIAAVAFRICGSWKLDPAVTL